MPKPRRKQHSTSKKHKKCISTHGLLHAGHPLHGYVEVEVLTRLTSGPRPMAIVEDHQDLNFKEFRSCYLLHAVCVFAVIPSLRIYFHLSLSSEESKEIFRFPRTLQHRSPERIQALRPVVAPLPWLFVDCQMFARHVTSVYQAPGLWIGRRTARQKAWV